MIVASILLLGLSLLQLLCMNKGQTDTISEARAFSFANAYTTHEGEVIWRKEYQPVYNAEAGQWCHKHIDGWCYDVSPYYRANETVLRLEMDLVRGDRSVTGEVEPTEVVTVELVMKHGENLRRVVRNLCDEYDFVSEQACNEIYRHAEKKLRSSVKGDLLLFDDRKELGAILEKRGAKVGAELGVAWGHFAARTLLSWPSAREYSLVDAWTHMDGYFDNNNFQHDEKYEMVLERMQHFTPRTSIVICKNLTSICVDDFEDEHFDFIYIDAGHDFASVYEDLTLWWPKLKPGGVFAGHDYVAQFEKPTAYFARKWHTKSKKT